MVHCRFFVDSVMIWVFPNNKRLGVLYQQKQVMQVVSSILNADNWATQGGFVKINWSHFHLQNIWHWCKWNRIYGEATRVNENASKWWDMPSYSSLTPRQRLFLRWVHQNYIIYGYYNDSTRFPTSPPECAIFVSSPSYFWSCNLYSRACSILLLIMEMKQKNLDDF